MANSIRTPKLGNTEKSRAIAVAVDNEDWQKFRLTLKGKTTLEKLEMLHYYQYSEIDSRERELRRIRVVNYHGALSRGGQLKKGLDLDVPSINLTPDIVR